MLKFDSVNMNFRYCKIGNGFDLKLSDSYLK